jgi:hypothetical protein
MSKQPDVPKTKEERKQAWKRPSTKTARDKLRAERVAYAKDEMKKVKP